MALLLLAAFLAVAAPGELKGFGDWIVGCDNGRACEAIALRPEDEGDDWLTLSLERGAEAEAPVRLRIHAEGAATGLSIDGKALAARLVPSDDGDEILPAQPTAFLVALRNGAALHLNGNRGRIGRVSLKGVAAAMRYMDHEQGRAGSTSALAAQGSRRGLATPPPPLPQIRIAPAAEGSAIALSPAQAASIRRDAGCDLEEVGGPDTLDSYPLASGRTLILLACGSGAYNVTHLPFVAREEAGRLITAPALFDALAPESEADRTELVNAHWDPLTRRLSDFPRARGLGDCGTRSTYGWDGERFRLLERETMDECRGSIDYIRIWRAEAVAD